MCSVGGLCDYSTERTEKLVEADASVSSTDVPDDRAGKVVCVVATHTTVQDV